MKYLLGASLVTIGFALGIATMASFRPVIEYKAVNKMEPAAQLQLSCAKRDVLEYLRVCRARAKSEAIHE